jgi:hypothetical protein
MKRTVIAILVSALLASSVVAQNGGAAASDEPYLSWTASQAQAIGEAAYRQGRVGGFWDSRILKTERAYNYKLAATMLSPQAIRATARLLQLRGRLTSGQTRDLVAEAEAAGGTVVMVEIDPREGSGVIPLEWEAFLQPKDRPSEAVRGMVIPALRDVKALAGVLRRNYDYDRFWMVFPNGSEAAYRQPGVTAIELVVRIHDKEGRVSWPVSSESAAR